MNIFLLNIYMPSFFFFFKRQYFMEEHPFIGVAKWNYMQPRVSRALILYEQ